MTAFERSPAGSPAPAVRVARSAPLGVHGGPDGRDGSPVRADFSTSVNAYGPAPSVLNAVRAALTPDQLGPYPDPTSRRAREALAAYCGADAEAVALGAGAAELIQAVMLAFAGPGDRVLVPPHAFGEYARAAAVAGARVAPPSPDGAAGADAWTLGGPVDAAAEAFARAVGRVRPRVAVLCAPESPSGRAWSPSAVGVVADACAAARALLLLDQSFDGFLAQPLGTPALRGHPAVLHLHSLTKDHALAGLRVGYLLGPPALVAAVERVRVPWAVGAPAQAAAAATCAPEALAHVRETTARLRRHAVELAAGCAALGAPPVPSDVHYFLFDVGDAGAAARLLRERHGVRVRDCASFGLPRHVRVAARRPDENQLLLDALADAPPRVPAAEGGTALR